VGVICGKQRFRKQKFLVLFFKKDLLFFFTNQLPSGPALPGSAWPACAAAASLRDITGRSSKMSVTSPICCWQASAVPAIAYKGHAPLPEVILQKKDLLF